MLKQQSEANRNNLVIGLKGLKGSGKTLVMTLLLYAEYKNGRKIYTNYEVNFPHKILDVEKLVKLDIQLQNAVIGIDELHMICDSRRSGKKQNILLSYFVLQSRHRSIDLYYTTQFNGQVDKRIRENTDINIICENLFIDSDNDGNNDLFRIIVQDKRSMPIRLMEKVIYGQPVFNAYNSDHIVDIFTMKEIRKLQKKGEK